jgi:hypothetical protein
MIDAQLQRTMAFNIKATITEIESGHVSMLSHPDIVANTIIAAAASLR